MYCSYKGHDHVFEVLTEKYKDRPQLQHVTVEVKQAERVHRSPQRLTEAWEPEKGKGH